jgi:small subunit ribosomal protein S13|tara:strand:- start:2719 stop:3084 length:366 start_codon:yes stop_codon:yes gene_type:complete
MFKLFGRKIKPDASLKKGLCLVYGLGEPTAKRICLTLGLNPDIKVSELSSKRVHGKIQLFLKVNNINPSAIKKTRRDFVQALIAKKSYSGMRHKNKYPVRGQRTKTNARTQKRIGSKHAKI